MKFFLFVLTSFFSLNVIAQSNFEGVIKITSSEADGLNAVFTVKGDKTHMDAKDANGKTVEMISDKKTGEIITISEVNGKKSASKLNVNDLPQGFGSASSGKSSLFLKVTDETKKIGGYTCVKVIGKDDKTEGEAWVAKDLKLKLSDLFPLAAKSNDGPLGWQNNQEVKGFIMELTTTDLETNKVQKMQAEVSKKKVKDEVFEVPEGTQVNDLSKNMQMMKNFPDEKEVEEMRKKAQRLQQQHQQGATPQPQQQQQPAQKNNLPNN